MNDGDLPPRSFPGKQMTEWSHPERPDDEYMDFILKQVWENLKKNGSGMWGTTANGLLSKSRIPACLCRNLRFLKGLFLF